MKGYKKGIYKKEKSFAFKNKTIEKKCEICSKIFSDFISRKRKFCSQKCFHEYKKTLVGEKNKCFGKPHKLKGTAIHITKPCEICENDFKSKPSYKQRFCSTKCLKKYQGSNISRKIHSEGQIGEKGNNWKGGIEKESKRQRLTLNFKLWRESVFKRDDWKCQKCETRGGELHPHHILNFSSHTELRFIVENGITLCVECHKEFHHIFGRKNNTREQLLEFISYKKFL